ncbi:hypothetical protein [Haloarchaeobius sp. DFWS5]|uniref:hypothetical protein n=1 Tax=Haloarchaeobius sp. DFWS5 TaxID=3446114 RepID=UPI003EBD55C9
MTRDPTLSRRRMIKTVGVGLLALGVGSGAASAAEGQSAADGQNYWVRRRGFARARRAYGYRGRFYGRRFHGRRFYGRRFHGRRFYGRRFYGARFRYYGVDPCCAAVDPCADPCAEIDPCADPCAEVDPCADPCAGGLVYGRRFYGPRVRPVLY